MTQAQVRRADVAGIVLLLALSLAACGGDGAGPPRQPAIGELATIIVATGADDAGRNWQGVVEAVQQATLSAQTSGRVAQVLYDVNDRVSAGEVLLRLSAVEQQATVDMAGARLRAAEAAAVEAEASLRRYRELSRAQHVSQAQLDQMQSARDAAVAARAAARAELASARQQLDYTTLRAPYDGIVASRVVEPGESVVVGQLLMTVFAPDALRIQVAIPQADAASLRADARARVHLDDGRSLAAAHVVVFPAADPASHALKVRVQLPALDPAPTPGTSLRVGFPALHGTPHPRIPASAVIQRGELSAVYVMADGRLALRQLRLGRISAGQVDVIAGLAPGETIAADPVAARQALVAARGGH
ncbi:MAG: efflux RND transporter periplasmic adaptor subunit [Xanthomonadales bacterium]|nr:efflux RND transporter periplasmic adaptor subunit [Xanthomonadales bacterium]